MASRFPNLFCLDKRKSCFLADRLSPQGAIWAWEKKPALPADIQELQQLSRVLEGRTLNQEQDSWRSKLSSDGKFYVHDIRKLVDSKITAGLTNPTIWLSLVPIKVNCFVWRASIDRIPSAIALARRGINMNTTTCRLCPNGIEEVDL